ncbi:MAG: MaoC family dehydratase [Lysobacteraceae bacterium]|nr:MAG: MaoC family dehydratase [Xanthomonadaceae bacterium]
MSQNPMPANPTIDIWWEDMTVGESRSLGSTSPTREQILAFATQFDPQPFHTDDEAAKNSVFGALCASGWHTCSMAMRLMVDNFLRRSSSLGSPGMESIKWLKPVYPGDVLSLQYTVLESRPMNSRPDVGLVRTVWAMHNQDGVQVLHMEGWSMFRRRTPGKPGTPGALAATGNGQG